MSSQAQAAEEMLEQAAQLVMSGRQVALVASDHEVLSALLGELAMGLIEFGAEIVRIDALATHAPDAVLAALADAMQVPVSELAGVLRLRADTSNPLLVLVDNAECLSLQALSQLTRLNAVAAGGVGLALAGEQELQDLLAESGLEPELVFDADELGDAAIPLLDESTGAGLVLPWKHISAVVGLLLLVWLLWPREEAAEHTRELALPEPMVVPEVVAEPDDQPGAEPAPVFVEPEPEPEPAPESAPAPEPVPEPEPQPAQAVAPAPTPARDTAPETAPPTGLAAELGIREEDWLLAQAEDRWVLQLALAGSEDAARRQIAQLGGGVGAYYRAQRSGKVVYIVLAAHWATRDEALQARAALPPSLRDRGPFPRPMAEIQSEILAGSR